MDTILHGDYRAWYADHDVPDPVPWRALHFGILRPYKGIEGLLEAFAAVTTEDARLRVVGQPADDALAALITAAGTTDPRVTSLLGHADDATLAQEIGLASLVVLPYREMHNSGALLLALSLRRPVLVPSNPVTEALADEVGRRWVRTFVGDLTARALGEALADPISPEEPGPDLSRRGWADIGLRHRDTYRAAVAQRASR